MTYVGAPRPRLLFIGEAFGQSEAEHSSPFVGFAGRLLWQMIGEADVGGDPEGHAEVTAQMHRGTERWLAARDEWLASRGLAFTNVFEFRPSNNDLATLCWEKKEYKENVGHDPPEVAIAKRAGTGPQLFLRPEHLPSVTRLSQEISLASPNLCCLLGNTASWALLQSPSISAIRGTTVQGINAGAGAGIKCLPTYHPAGVMRNWSWKVIVLADLMKAWRESSTRELLRPSRKVAINCDLDYLRNVTEILEAHEPDLLSVDIETAGGQITEIGFAWNEEAAMVFKFRLRDGNNYWRTAADEVQAWRLVSRLLRLRCAKVFQNGMYEFQWFAEAGLSVAGPIEDTMLMHHAIFLEMQKSLGFLGSIYTNEPAWKIMRRRKKDVMEKADE